MTNSQLIKEIEDFAKKKGLAGATVTSRGVGNSKLYAQLKRGKSCTLTVAERLMTYIDEQSRQEPAE